MPKVDGKHFAYTKKGKKAARRAKAAMMLKEKMPMSKKEMMM